MTKRLKSCLDCPALIAAGPKKRCSPCSDAAFEAARRASGKAIYQRRKAKRERGGPAH